MPAPRTNLLLDALSVDSRDAILAEAKEISFPIRQSLQAQEAATRHVYFMTSGIASVVVTLLEGETGETAIIGREGMVGAIALLGPTLPPSQTFSQIAGTAFRLPFAAMQQLFDRSDDIRSRVLQCAQQQAWTTTQIAACNNAHEAEPRLARWLLMVQDRTGEDTFQLTQEFLSQMLGARRTTVALAAGALQRSGYIEYARGKITIRSRENLEHVACDCYPVTKRLLQGLYR